MKMQNRVHHRVTWSSSSSNLEQHSEKVSPKRNNVFETVNLPKKSQRLLDIELGFVPRKSWSTTKKSVVFKVFSDYIEANTLPSKDECLSLIEEHSALIHRTPPQIMSYAHNQINRKADNRVKKRHTWEPLEKETLWKAFSEHLKRNSYPSAREIKLARINYPILQGRTVGQIKSQYQHHMKKRNSY